MPKQNYKIFKFFFKFFKMEGEVKKMAETFYFTRDNGTPGGCKVMSAQFIKLDVHEWGSTYTKTAHTERLVKDCRTEAEAVEVFRQLPLPVKLS